MSGLTKEELIRLRAYAIWIEEGQPEGREREHWEKARSEMCDVGRDSAPGAPGEKPDGRR